MNSITTLESESTTNAVASRKILSKSGFTGALLTLAPGQKTELARHDDAGECVVFVVEGDATVTSGEINTLLNKDDAHLLPKAGCFIASRKGAKLLRLDIPPRQVITPPIFTVESDR